jgi:VIT1/CCC1 family predicted Fe2+/Mn2+ transporter
MYLMARLHEKGRTILTLHAAREASNPDAARDAIADAMPPPLASVLPKEQLESIRQKLRQLPEPPLRPSLTKNDWVGAVAICLLVFLSTLPVAIPFMLIDDARLALRVSNAIAIVMLFLCGYLFGHHAGLLPWAAGLCSVAIGSVLVVVAIALGG